MAAQDGFKRGPRALQDGLRLRKSQPEYGPTCGPNSSPTRVPILPQKECKGGPKEAPRLPKEARRGGTGRLQDAFRGPEGASRGPYTPDAAERLDSPHELFPRGGPRTPTPRCFPYPNIVFLSLLGRPRPSHSLSRLPRALTSTDTQTYSNSGSLTLSLTHTQTHSHSDPLTHRPLIIPIAYGPPVLPENKQYKINVFPLNMDVLSSTSQNVWKE